MSGSFEDLKVKFVDFSTTYFKDLGSDTLSDIWEIAVLIIEDISNLDLDRDGVVDHCKKEILEVAKDKLIEWGDELSEVVVRGLSGGELKRMVAAAGLAKWIANLGFMSYLGPFASVFINLLIEWIVTGLKNQLEKAHGTLHQKALENTKEINEAIKKLITAIQTKYPGLNASTQHAWGVNMFSLFVENPPKDGSNVGQVLTLYGSLRGLTTAISEGTFDTFMEKFYNAIRLSLDLGDEYGR